MRDRHNYKLYMKSLQAIYKTNMKFISSFKKTLTINLRIFHFYKENIMDGQNRFLIVIEPRQHQEPLVFFHNIYIYIDLWKHNTYKFCIKNKKYIYCVHTGVDPGMSTMDDASCRHPNHSSRANISQTASVEWNSCLPICDL